MAPTSQSSAAPVLRFLRYVTIFLFIPAFPLEIASGVMHWLPGLFVGFIPHCFSIIIGFNHIKSLKIEKDSPELITLLDSIAASLYLATLIPCWVQFGQRTWVDAETVYATVFMVATLSIHSGLVVFGAYSVMTARPQRSCSCPHTHDCEAAVSQNLLKDMEHEEACPTYTALPQNSAPTVGEPAVA